MAKLVQSPSEVMSVEEPRFSRGFIFIRPAIPRFSRVEVGFGEDVELGGTPVPNV